MSSKYILINRYVVKDGMEAAIRSFVSQRCQASPQRSSFYVSEQHDEVIEFVGYGSLSDFNDDQDNLHRAFIDFKNYLCGDVRRELIQYVESPLASKTAFPMTPYVQLRHVEVLPAAYDAYLTWRDETIFNVVRENAGLVESFDAYHSLISGVPGVMFISCFSADVSDYVKPFTDARYKKIVSEAGDSYITGGDEGLYTKIYKKVA